LQKQNKEGAENGFLSSFLQRKVPLDEARGTFLEGENEVDVNFPSGIRGAGNCKVLLSLSLYRNKVKTLFSATRKQL
jgi:hypothetical protein